MMSTRWQKVRWLLPVILMVTTMIDAALPAIFPKAFLNPSQLVISHLTLYFIVMFAFYFKDHFILPMSFIFGLFYDAYNTTVLGINATLYLIIAYAILQVKRLLPKNAIVFFMLFIISVTFLDLCVYGVYYQIGLAHLSLMEVFAQRLASTLVFNIVLALFMHFPKNWLLDVLGFEDYIIF